MKYFIEREDGSWLMEPDGPLSSTGCWTRDPHKAWQFEENREPMKWMSKPVRDPKDPLTSYSWGIMNLGRPGQHIIDHLVSEGLFAADTLTITEHEFIKAWDNEHLLDYNHDIWHDTGERQFRRMSSAAIARDTGIKI